MQRQENMSEDAYSCQSVRTLDFAADFDASIVTSSAPQPPKPSAPAIEQSTPSLSRKAQCKAYLIQLYGFLVKVYTHRWRTPVITALELLLPCVFTLLMCVAYWTSESRTVPAEMYDGGDHVVWNMSNFASYYFCKMPTSTLQVPWKPCNLSAGAHHCLSLLGNGQDVCAGTRNMTILKGLLFTVYYGSGPVTTNTMDAHIALSALATEIALDEDPTFFGRSGRASLAHYGELLVASEDEALGLQFMDFCRINSGLCGVVLHPRVFPSMDAAEEYALEHANRVWAAVYLAPGSLSAGPRDDVEFTIMMNYSATADTFGERSGLLIRGLKAKRGQDSYILYWASGFMTLQTFLHEFYLQHYVATVPIVGPAEYFETSSTEPAQIRYISPHGAGFLPMPTRERYDNAFLTEWVYYTPLIAVMAALFPVARLTGLMVEEKESGIREAMLIMGMNPSCLFAGWYASALPVDLVASLLAAMVMKVGFLHHVHYGVLLVLYFTFMQQNTALSILMSTLFSNPRIASWCSAFVVFVCAIPHYTFPSGMSAGARKAVTMIPCVGYAESFAMLAKHASFGLSFGWSEAQSGAYSISAAIGIMWASFVTMMLLSLYLDRVAPAAVGRRAHPLFFLQGLWRCLRRREVLEVRMTPGGVAMDEEAALLHEHREDVVNPRDPEVAAVFERLRKVYRCGGFFGFVYTYFTGMLRAGDRVVALDDVTFAMRRGEVSVLLGANGSGKSTIMGLATGMVRPSSGRVFVEGHDADYDLAACRRGVGYCPQADIVWPLLTVEEHLSFYARLKGTGTFAVGDAVATALEYVGLEEQRGCLAAQLSGGQRRRLCVAVALVGDSRVLFLDEPTAGMDVRGRRTVYEALRRARANRSVLLCTHLLDEADRVGDRVLLLHRGRLCGEGSPMYLKSQMRVGYVVTCVVESGLGSEEEAVVARLIDFVREKGYTGHAAGSGREVQAVPPTCQLLGVERRGREVSFRFPLSLLSSSGCELLELIHGQSEELRLRSVGMSLTTLQDVFMTVAQEEPLMQAPMITDDGAVWAGVSTKKDAPDDEDQLALQDMYTDRNAMSAFFCHFYALLAKRLHFAKRDMKLLMFQVVIPVLFLLLALLIDLARAPQQPSMVLDMTMYEDHLTNPSAVMMSYGYFGRGMQNGFALSTETPNEALGKHYIADYFDASRVPMQTCNGTLPMSTSMLSDIYSYPYTRYVAVVPSGCLMQAGRPQNRAAVFHNTTAPHSSPQALSTLYNLAAYQLFGPQVPVLAVRNRPMRMGEFETELVEATKQVMVGIFVILPFVLMPSNIISYVVREQESGARHMQWLSGANVLAYWLSAFVFDALCYAGTVGLSFAIFAAFGRSEYTSREMVGPSMTLFLLFGVSSIPFSYMLSFFFRSPFAAQSAVLLANFVFGFLWVTVESMLLENMFESVKAVMHVLRVLPAVSFGEGMFIVSGQRLATMMFPKRVKPNMYGFLHMSPKKPLFTGGVGTSLLYMGCTLAVSIVVLSVVEYLRLQRLTLAALRCGKSCRETKEAVGEGGDAWALLAADESVAAEEARVCASETGPAEDRIAMQHLRKRYAGAARAAVEDVSMGVHGGEIMCLLGLNGAGKTTTVSMLAGEVMPSGGAAFVNHVSVTSSRSRSYVGYCPQYDALLDNLTPTEHLWLYARLRGMREELIAEEVAMLLRELGLEAHRRQTACALSGGNRRRLSLAVALVGRTTSILLDEPTAGMDTVARAQTCEMVRRLTANKSVVLTTHLLDEADALADRVGIMAAGRLRCVGTPQELKGRYTQDAVYSLRVLFEPTVDLDGAAEGVPALVCEHMLQQLRSTGEGVEPSCEVEEVQRSAAVFSVRGRLSDVCRAVCALRAGTVAGVPAVAYVGVTQPTLEDILLLD